MFNILDEVLFFLLPPLAVFAAGWAAKRMGKSYGTQVIYQFIALCLLFAVNFYLPFSRTFVAFTLFLPYSFGYYLFVFVVSMLATEFFDEKSQ